MRPAQKAPENYFSRSGCAAVRIDFNEAGAKSAGKLLQGCGLGWPFLKLQ